MLYVDVDAQDFRPVRDLFKSFRPDIVVRTVNMVYVWELTVCHETYFVKSKQFKTEKYAQLAADSHYVFASVCAHCWNFNLRIYVWYIKATCNYKLLNIADFPVDLLTSLTNQGNKELFLYLLRTK